MVSGEIIKNFWSKIFFDFGFAKNRGGVCNKSVGGKYDPRPRNFCNPQNIASFQTFWFQKIQKIFNNFSSSSWSTATAAPHDPGGWNVQVLQVLGREVICQTSLKTIDFPHDVLFYFKSSRKKFVFSSRSQSTAAMTTQGLGGWNFQETQFLKRTVMCQNFQEASLRTVDFPQDGLLNFKK